MGSQESPSAAAYRLEPATAADADRIKSLVRGERLNPLGLDWRRFTVARDVGGEVLGCVQVKPHRDGTRELASLVVREDLRGLGIGSRLVRHCQQDAGGRLYLTCRARLGGYYHQLGFEVVPPEALPPYFKRISKLVDVIGVFFPAGDGLLVMQWGPG